jgi:hypothetical protein
MALKTYGSVDYGHKQVYNLYRFSDDEPVYIDSKDSFIVIEKAEPHVMIRMKEVFPIIAKTETCPVHIPVTDIICEDLKWFFSRYPMVVSDKAQKILNKGSKKFREHRRRVEEIMMPDYVPPVVVLNEGEQAREYQLKVPPFQALQKRFLLADDIGLGKTLSAILTLFNPGTLPCAIVVDTHLPKQWKEGGVERFTNLNTHIVKNGPVYDLPQADVYIFKYSILAKWVDVFATGFFKTAIFDEIQSVRHVDTKKHQAAKKLSENVHNCIGLSATPIYNYGDEIFPVMNIIKPGCLGHRDDFLREWCTHIGSNKHRVNDTAALGTFLREQYLMLRRTREEVGRQLPVINKMVHYVDYDEDEVKNQRQLMKKLAISVTTGSFVERGQAARELNIHARMITGISKAKSVAMFCRLLLENNIPIVLAGWHREVYNIWLEELAEFNPVLFTGTESPKQKSESVEKFKSGHSKCFIISLRSGAGLDGLQYLCNVVVIGELDWSPKVQDQLIGRVDRDGQPLQVDAYYTVSDFGTDPIMLEILGLKNQQSSGILNPFQVSEETFSDDSRIVQLAKNLLEQLN